MIRTSVAALAVAALLSSPVFSQTAAPPEPAAATASQPLTADQLTMAVNKPVQERFDAQMEQNRAAEAAYEKSMDAYRQQQVAYEKERDRIAALRAANDEERLAYEAKKADYDKLIATWPKAKEPVARPNGTKTSPPSKLIPASLTDGHAPSALQPAVMASEPARQPPSQKAKDKPRAKSCGNSSQVTTGSIMGYRPARCQ